MSLITCPDCRKDVSTSAPACPHCGLPQPAAQVAPTSTRPTGQLAKIAMLIGIVVGLLVVGMFISDPQPASSGQSQPTSRGTTRLADQMEILSWNWSKDPSYGYDGAVKWNVQIRNNSPDYIEHVRVEFVTFDKAGKLIASEFTYVSAIPPGGTRSASSYADYFGTEESAGIQVVEAYRAR